MFLLFMMLIGFPAVSWYYLNGGLDYRVNAKNELKNYGNIRQLSLTSLDDKQVFTDSLSVYLLQTNHSPLLDSVFKVILQAYDARNDIQALDCYCNGQSRTDTSAVINMIRLKNDINICDFLKNTVDAIKTKSNVNADVILVDTKGNVVQGYNLGVSDDRARLIKHVSILMPNVVRSDKPVKSIIREK